MSEDFVTRALALIDVPAEPDTTFASDLRAHFFATVLETAGEAVRPAPAPRRPAARDLWARSTTLPRVVRPRPVFVWVGITATIVAVVAWFAWGRAATREMPIIDSPPVIESPSPTVPTSPSPTQRVMGLATDQPCTRPVPDGMAPEQLPLQAEDLVRMVLTREDVGAGIETFDDDIFRNGFIHNAELHQVEVHPDWQLHADAFGFEHCAEFEDLGRIMGYARGWAAASEPPRSVYTSAHLFWDEQGAADWVEGWVDESRWGVGLPDGPSRFDLTPADDIAEGAWRIEHEGWEGVRSWVVVRRGPIVGWVVDLHPGTTTTIDVDAAARALVARIDDVMATAVTATGDSLDLASMMSVPLPLAAWGDRYAALDWNGDWGGCTDLDEWSLIVDDATVEWARQRGMLYLCTGMYGPDGAPEGRYLQVWTRISVFPDEASADAYLGDGTNTNPTAESFDVTGLEGVDEATGVVSAPSEDSDLWGTRVQFRRGRYVFALGLNDNDPRDARDELVTLAQQLDDRFTALVDGRAP